MNVAIKPNKTNLYFNLVCPGRSRLEYCFERAPKLFSPLPEPPLAVSHVGLAAVVIFQTIDDRNSNKFRRRKKQQYEENGGEHVSISIS